LLSCKLRLQKVLQDLTHISSKKDDLDLDALSGESSCEGGRGRGIEKVREGARESERGREGFSDEGAVSRQTETTTHAGAFITKLCAVLINTAVQ